MGVIPSGFRRYTGSPSLVRLSFLSPDCVLSQRAMLTDKAIQALQPDSSRSGSKHHDRDGLYLWMARSGSKTWRKLYRWQGVRQTFTIGTYPKVRVADAVATPFNGPKPAHPRSTR